MPIPPNGSSNHLRNGSETKHELGCRLEMIALALQDCDLDHQNIYIKTYERDCFNALFPGMDVSSQEIAVRIDCTVHP